MVHTLMQSFEIWMWLAAWPAFLYLYFTVELTRTLKDNPYAEGLLLVIASDHCRDMPKLTGIQAAVTELANLFHKFNYAIYSPPVNSIEDEQYLKALIEAVIACMNQLPQSYRRLFVYCTGHGGVKEIYLPGGRAHESLLFQLLGVSDLTKVLIIDACRNGQEEYEWKEKDIPTRNNVMIIYSTMMGTEAFADSRTGGLMTRALIEHLRCDALSLPDIMTRVTQDVQKTSNGQMHPTCLVCGLQDDINLLQEYQKKSELLMKVCIHCLIVHALVAISTSGSIRTLEASYSVGEMLWVKSLYV